ncbi:MAG TPA: triose-phosphate isomerase [Rhodospirillaceae bacterium]|nr:triose-phosphate isomerase [Rhodospirillaceae bacterium]HAA92209.1 triose-phosphate isomerase [Rhodospirillaceae bacterium]HAT34295.1 triose-phosphate isomerase [Rhodospirillaceae bacterium]
MTSSRRPLIAGNWKMNLDLAQGTALAKAVANSASDYECELLVCPPALYLASVGHAISDSPVGLGAQDCHPQESGAHTGDISAAMLTDLNCTYVILGHSERRADHGEQNDDVAAKVSAAWAQGLCAIICVGETDAERDSGETLQVVAEQIRGSVPNDANATNTVIAYEPVWAIGSGKTPTPDDVAEVHGAIRAMIGEKAGNAAANDMRILYGGSLKPDNAKQFLALADVDGGLIGGASLQAEDFLAIAASCP